jgi:hypothetical protein
LHHRVREHGLKVRIGEAVEVMEIRLVEHVSGDEDAVRSESKHRYPLWSGE